MIALVIVVLILAVIGLASLAFFWRGMLVGRDQIPTPRRIMLEMQQLHAVALGTVTPEPKKLPEQQSIKLNGIEIRPSLMPPDSSIYQAARPRSSSPVRRRRRQHQLYPVSLIHGDYGR